MTWEADPNNLPGADYADVSPSVQRADLQIQVLKGNTVIKTSRVRKNSNTEWVDLQTTGPSSASSDYKMRITNLDSHPFGSCGSDLGQVVSYAWVLRG